MCTVLLPPGDNPIAINKYIIYHIKEILRRYYKDCFLITAKPIDRFLFSQSNERYK
jgi:hypothetical protein